MGVGGGGVCNVKDPSHRTNILFGPLLEEHFTDLTSLNCNSTSLVYSKSSLLL